MFNFSKGDEIGINGQNGNPERFRRSTLDEMLPSCRANYDCVPRSACQQPEFFNPVERSIISATSCQPDFKSSEPYVCCPKKPEQSGQPSSLPDQSMSALKVVKGMGDKMLRIMLDPKKNANQGSKIASQSKSDSVDGYDGFMDEILSTLENMKS